MLLVPVAGSSILQKAQGAMDEPRTARQAFLLPARFRVFDHAFDLDLDAVRHGLGLHCLEQLALLVETAILPGSYQKFHPWSAAPGTKQFKHIRLLVADRNQPGLAGQLRRSLESVF